MLTVDTAATVTDLVELNTVKQELCIEGSTEDAKLRRLIAAASDVISEFLQMPPYRQTYTETLPGSGQVLLTLSRIPVVSVSSVLIDSGVITDYSIEEAKAGLLYREVGWPWGVQADAGGLTSHPLPGSAKRTNVTVSYVAGYLLPGETNRNLPAAIEEAALQTVINWRADSSGGAVGSGAIKTQKMGDTSTTFDTGGGLDGGGDPLVYKSGLPPRVVAMLRKYRVMVDV